MRQNVCSQPRFDIVAQEMTVTYAGDGCTRSIRVALPGVDTVTALTVLAELGGITRFGSAWQLFATSGSHNASAGAELGSGEGRSRQRATPTCSGCWWRAPGTTTTGCG